MMVRGVRGAITVEENTEESIWQATEIMLKTIIHKNNIQESDVASILFTMTPDLNACYPATSARRMGWHSTALMGFQESDVPNGVQMCIRVLIHWNTNKPQDEIQHCFMGRATTLRPDLSKSNVLEE